MAKLPNELLLLIFEELPINYEEGHHGYTKEQLSDVLNARLVCRDWYQLTRNVFNNAMLRWPFRIVQKDLMFLENVIEEGNYAESIKELRFNSQFPSDRVMEVLDKFRNNKNMSKKIRKLHNQKSRTKSGTNPNWVEDLCNKYRAMLDSTRPIQQDGYQSEQLEKILRKLPQLSTIRIVHDPRLLMCQTSPNEDEDQVLADWICARFDRTRYSYLNYHFSNGSPVPLIVSQAIRKAQCKLKTLSLPYGYSSPPYPYRVPLSQAQMAASAAATGWELENVPGFSQALNAGISNRTLRHLDLSFYTGSCIGTIYENDKDAIKRFLEACPLLQSLTVRVGPSSDILHVLLRMTSPLPRLTTLTLDFHRYAKQDDLLHLSLLVVNLPSNVKNLAIAVGRQHIYRPWYPVPSWETFFELMVHIKHLDTLYIEFPFWYKDLRQRPYPSEPRDDQFLLGWPSYPAFRRPHAPKRVRIGVFVDSLEPALAGTGVLSDIDVGYELWTNASYENRDVWNPPRIVRRDSEYLCGPSCIITV